MITRQDQKNVLPLELTIPHKSRAKAFSEKEWRRIAVLRREIDRLNHELERLLSKAKKS